MNWKEIEAAEDKANGMFCGGMLHDIDPQFMREMSTDLPSVSDAEVDRILSEIQQLPGVETAIEIAKRTSKL
jgi:hypothetical protein